MTGAETVAAVRQRQSETLLAFLTGKDAGQEGIAGAKMQRCEKFERSSKKY